MISMSVLLRTGDFDKSVERVEKGAGASHLSLRDNDLHKCCRLRFPQSDNGESRRIQTRSVRSCGRDCRQRV